jgi:hypothetical protein
MSLTGSGAIALALRAGKHPARSFDYRLTKEVNDPASDVRQLAKVFVVLVVAAFPLIDRLDARGYSTRLPP